MKNPKLIVKPFAKNGQKNVIPENYETSMESNQATWDQGFGQITMLPVAAGGLPPKGQDFNGIFNQISENIVYLSQGGRFKFSAEYAEAIGGYPKGAILQSDDEKKEYLSLIDNNKVDFNTASDISASWKLVSTDDLLAQIASKQPKGDYATKTELNSGLAGKQPVGDYATKTEVNSKLAKDQNGADIPNKDTFIENLGLPEKYQPKGDYQPSGDYVKTPPALLDGNKKITEQLFGGLGVGIRTQSPFPSDAPVQSAFKIMQIGDDGWPTLIGLDAYQRRIFITTRKSQGGELNPWDELIRESRLSTLPFFGQGQTYQNYLSSRTPNTAYTNSSGRTIFIVVSAVQDTSGVPVVLTAVVDGNEITTHSYGSSARATISIPIPDKSWYRINVSGGSNARVVTWLEVRE